MLVYKTSAVVRKDFGRTRYVWTGWYLLGFIPLIIWRVDL